MMYPYVTFNDDTEITHSEMLPDGRVKVYIETPDIKDGFHNAICYLPDYTWEDINGYTDTEIDYFTYRIFSKRGNFECLKFLELGHISFTFGQMRMIRLSLFMSILQKAGLQRMQQKFG